MVDMMMVLQMMEVMVGPSFDIQRAWLNKSFLTDDYYNDAPVVITPGTILLPIQLDSVLNIGL